jgi:hypothetical protein
VLPVVRVALFGADFVVLANCRQVRAAGIVSKRRGSTYRGGESREWLKSKCFRFGVFAITGFRELGEGRLEAIGVAEEHNGILRPAGQIQFALAGQGLWPARDRTRARPEGLHPGKARADGRDQNRPAQSGWIRDGVVRLVATLPHPRLRIHGADGMVVPACG